MADLDGTRIPPVEADLEMLLNVMKATGLPLETIEELMMTNDDLFELCDSVLSELASPPNKVGSIEA